MFVRKSQRLQFGGSAFESLIVLPVVLTACLLTLQMMLIYRAKIALNFATQEAARVGAMSNGRVVPRFLTDITQFSAVFRTKPKCFKDGVQVPNKSTGTCPTGSKPEPLNPRLSASNIPGATTSADGSEPTGEQFSPTSSTPESGGTTSTTPAAIPAASSAAAAETSNQPSAATKFLRSLARGMMRYGDSSVLQGFINGIAPLYTEGATFKDAVKGQVKAYGDAMMNSCIVYHNPTQAAFLDFGFNELDGPDRGALQIPNDLLRYRVPGSVDPSGKGIDYYHANNGNYLSEEEPGLRGKFSKMSVQDATLLSIEIKYSYPLDVPVAREILIGLAKLSRTFGDNETALGAAFIASSFAKDRWPLASFATYRMQTPVHWSMYYPFGDVTNFDSPNIEAFDAVKLLYNKILERVNNKFDPSEPQVGFCPGVIIDAARGFYRKGRRDADTTDDKVIDRGVGSWIGGKYDDWLYGN